MEVAYEFSKYTGKLSGKLYGRGTRSEANQYLQWLDTHSGGDWYITVFWVSTKDLEGIAFNLRDELTAIRDSADI
jgi:hypothetical protein